MTAPRARPAAAISVVVVVHNRIDLTRGCLNSLRQTERSFELCIVDNGSSDETWSYFREWAGGPRLSYHRNSENIGLVRALNQGASLARGDLLCFLHNDTEILDPRWLDTLETAVGTGRKVGLAGFYGARYVRRDGSYMGRSIVHSLAEAPTMRAAVAEVAVVDGLCLFVPRAVLSEVGGFDESYGFFHGYDQDLSCAVRATGRRCVVVNSRIIHRGGGTRTGPGAPVDRETDLAQRREAMAHFLRKWGHTLPVDVRGRHERLADRLRPFLPGPVQAAIRYGRQGAALVGSWARGKS